MQINEKITYKNRIHEIKSSMRIDLLLSIKYGKYGGFFLTSKPQKKTRICLTNAQKSYILVVLETNLILNKGK